jgi:hypothetical protein
MTEAPASRKRRYSVSLVAPICMALAAATGWWLLRVPGEPVGRTAVPGQIEVVLGAGDQLAFTADLDVLFDSPKRKAVPLGCTLELTLAQGSTDVAQTTCNLFKTSDATNVYETANTTEVEGKTRLTVTGQHLGCRFTVAAGGPSVIRATSNAATCVPRAYAIAVQAVRARP